ncbi:unnamed protein product [Protopolystoma xenopodis]|uniref:Uncharacterized protein n=1 Tax=Protopolystoma xenopodis TaxID=117903 RepID=A0A448WMT9_9PLAT|nr:unnamed protein product [Protopolystoma xenopodis]
MGVTRFCSSIDMGNQCQYLPFPDHDRIYRACIFTCSLDGCNSASRFGPGANNTGGGLNVLATAFVLVTLLLVLK